MSYSVWLPQINRGMCIGCGKCVAVCPTQALERQKEKAVLAYPERCTYCAACESLCPTEAIELPYLVCKSNTLSEGDHHA